MASLGSWALPRQTPTSDSRNQQQPLSYGQNQQQESSRQHPHAQPLNRSIYSVVGPSDNRRLSSSTYNGVLVDPALQEVNSAVHAQSSQSVDQQSGRVQVRTSTPLSAHRQSTGNEHLSQTDPAGQRRPSQQIQGNHGHSRQSQVLPSPLSGQDLMMQNMAVANSTDNARHNSANGLAGAPGTGMATPAQAYSTYAQNQQQSQQFQPQGSQGPWTGFPPTRRTSIENPNNKSERKAGLVVRPSNNGEASYPASSSDARQQNMHSSGQSTGQAFSGTSPANMVTNISHPNTASSHLGSTSGSTTAGDATSNTQWHFSHLNNRLDQLAKTQADMLSYLHVEMTRRKEWEEQLLKELKQRRGQVPAPNILDNEIPGLAGPRDPRWNNMARNSFVGNPMEANGNPSFPTNNGVSNTSAQGSYATWPHTQNSTQFAPNGIPSVFNPLAQPNRSKLTVESAEHFPGVTSQQAHPPGLSVMAMTANGISGFTAPTDRDQEQQGRVLPRLVDVSLSMPTQPDLNSNGFTDPAPAHVVDSVDGPQPTDDGERSKRKRKADGEPGTERPSKKLEVDERGVVIMMSGNTKLKEKPTKIQSVVRKTLYGSMGIPDVLDAKDMPIYEEGMHPPDGSNEWKFGNLRFDWNATLRRSVHNVAMREIVLKHITSLRAEYAEIPDSEFEPLRLEPAFDQAFGTWKGKYLGKRPGGIRRVMGTGKTSPKPKKDGGTGAAAPGEEEGATTGTLE